MELHISSLCFSALLLVCSAGVPDSDLQSLRQLLEEEMRLRGAPTFSAEEPDLQDQDGAERWRIGVPEGPPWEPHRDGVLARLLKDLAKTSKRSWSRYKKGGLRSCFGVRLDRIGSFSGLGC